jgi:hypothetical protein
VSDALLVLTDRLRQDRDARAASTLAAAHAIAATPRLAGSAHAPGDRVFDTVSGQEGEVIHVARQNLVVSTTR